MQDIVLGAHSYSIGKEEAERVGREMMSPLAIEDARTVMVITNGDGNHIRAVRFDRGPRRATTPGDPAANQTPLPPVYLL